MSKAIWIGAVFSLVVGGLLMWALTRAPEGTAPAPGDFGGGVAGPAADIAGADGGVVGADGGEVARADRCPVIGPFAAARCVEDVVVAWVDARALTSAPICEALREGVGDPAALAPDVVAAQGKRLVEQAIDAALVGADAATRGVIVSDEEVAARLAGHDAVGAATRAEVRARLLERKWVEVAGKLEPDAAEVRAEFDEAPERFGELPRVKAEAWLARPIGGAEGVAKDRAAAWKAALERGERTPPDGVAAIEGAVFSPDGLEPALEEALWGPGQAADGGWLGPIGTRAGWLVVRVVERVPGMRPRFEDVEARVRVAATERRRVAETARLLAELRAKATIVRCVE